MKMMSKKYRNLILFFSVFSLISIRYLYYGVTYFYMLDDYIQYHNYVAFNGVWESISSLGLLAARPMAGLMDVTLWSALFPVMIVGVLLISAMYAGAALLLKTVFSRHFNTGWIFVVVLTLLPLGFEGTYWMSASTRIVCGLFFAALSAYLLQKFFDTGKRRYLIIALPMQLLSFGFYEQALVFSITLNVLLGLLSYKTSGKKVFWSLFSLVNAGIFFAFTYLFKMDSIYNQRLELVTFGPYYEHHFLPQLFEQIKSAFLGGGFYTTAKGFIRGARILVADRAVLFTIGLLILCALLFVIAKKSTKQAKHSCLALLCGFLLALAPVTPFFLIAQTWFSFRCTVMSFAGIALLADALFQLIFYKMPYRDVLSAAGAAILAFVFCIGGISELTDYKMTYEKDIQIGKTILEQVDVTEKEVRIGILNIEPSYLPNQNYYYHEHIHGVTESSWALTGLLQFLSNYPQISMVTPLSVDTYMYEAYNYGTNKIESFDRVYFYHDDTKEILQVTYKKTGEKTFDVFFPDGTLCAQIIDDQGIGYIILP